MQILKYHALGNDYIVLNPLKKRNRLTPDEIRLICHRHYGVGSDGILWGPLKKQESHDCDFALRIFNPDGSEAEKSGNGLRIFSRYLWDVGLAKKKKFTIWTLGGKVRSHILGKGENVTVEMGKATFNSKSIPVAGPSREVINETIVICGQELRFCAVSVGNPHCVLPRNKISRAETLRLGSLIENDPRFPNRINVQFMKVLDRSNIQIEIWERGAGYTLASGSSSCAAAAVAHRLGLCNSKIGVHMPGGKIEISFGKDLSILMTGPVAKVYQGIISDEIFRMPLPK